MDLSPMFHLRRQEWGPLFEISATACVASALFAPTLIARDQDKDGHCIEKKDHYANSHLATDCRPYNCGHHQ